MSSTNRGSSYKDKTITDYYVTPISEILKFFAAVVEEESDIFSGSVVDPAAGGDPAHPASYPEALSEIGIPESMVSTIDIREDSRAAIKGKSYLEMELAEKPNLIITNPPFIIAQEFIEKALKDVRDGGYVVMLLRLNFFGSSRRKKLWEKSMPKYVFVHHQRMSFTDDSATDSVEYMHAVWKKGENPKSSKLFVI